MRNPSCVFRGCLVGTSIKQANVLPKLCPYIWGCEKEHNNSFLYDNDFGVVIYARNGPKHGSGDIQKQWKECTADDIASMFVGVPNAVN